MKLHGIANQTVEFLQENHLKNSELWAKFVDVFRSKPDGDGGWKGEFWGKMMRGATLVYEYTQNEGLYEILTNSVEDMLTVADENGGVSSYPKGDGFCGWDLWCRKYVILGCEYYLEICKDEDLKKRVLTFISRVADDIILHIGDQEGQKPITKASGAWYGLNSASILEPMIRLYRLTGTKKYLYFSTYILKTGGTEIADIFRLAYENEIFPYQYGVSKAYEMISCFEGLLEYYYATGIKDCKTAVERFAKAVQTSEVSVIGCCGITHELFDHTVNRQTVRQNEVMQETCVTVTWMKFCSRLLELTGDSGYADEMEKSFFNAYLGAVNVENRESKRLHELHLEWFGRVLKSTILPFDSYSPLTCGKRGRMTGGGQALPDNSYYGCCACIGSAGVGVYLRNAIVVKDREITVNFYEQGESECFIDGVKVQFTITTKYPIDGDIRVDIFAEKPVRFTLKFRNPAWFEGAKGYILYEHTGQSGHIDLHFDMPIKFHSPNPWEKDVVYTDTKTIDGYWTATPVEVFHNEEEDDYFCVSKGPLVLAADARMGKSPDSTFTKTDKFEVFEKETVQGVPCLLKIRFIPENGETYGLVDYSSAGKDWETEIAAWLPTKAR